MASDIQPGEAKRYDCGDCGREFEVCYEPKVRDAKDKAKAAKGLEPETVENCPFCASESITCEADDD